MKTIFEMPEDSRVWIYQADRTITDIERNGILSDAEEFILDWTSHGAKMEATIEVLQDRFLILAADEKKAQASGCGIDKSVKFIQSLGQKLGIDFFQRMQVIYKVDDEVKELPIHVFWASRKAGIILDNTILFDTTIKTVKELATVWEVPFSKSWHAEMWQR